MFSTFMLSLYMTIATWPLQSTFWENVSLSKVEVEDVDIFFHLPYVGEVMDEVVPWRVAHEKKNTYILQVLNKALTKPYVVGVLAFKVFLHCLTWLLWLVFVATLISSRPSNLDGTPWVGREYHHGSRMSLNHCSINVWRSLHAFVDLEMEGESRAKCMLTNLLHMYIY